jgi:hypothetical protein
MGVENPHNVNIIKDTLPSFSKRTIAKPRQTYKETVYNFGFPIKNKEFSDQAYKIRSQYLGLLNGKTTYKNAMTKEEKLIWKLKLDASEAIEEHDFFNFKIDDEATMLLILKYLRSKHFIDYYINKTDHGFDVEVHQIYF